MPVITEGKALSDAEVRVSIFNQYSRRQTVSGGTECESTRAVKPSVKCCPPEPSCGVFVEGDTRIEMTDPLEKDTSWHLEGSPTFLIRPLKGFLAPEEQYCDREGLF